MAYVTVPKDLTKIKSKMLFGLTKRQLVCFGSAALVGVPLFFLSKGSMGATSAALCMILVMLPFFLFALYEKNGQTLEVILRHLIQCISMNIFMLAGLFFLLRYVKKIRKDPTLSPMWSEGWRPDEAGDVAAEEAAMLKEVKLSGRTILILIIYLMQYVVMVGYPMVTGDTSLTFKLMVAMGLITSISCGFIGGFSFDKIGNEFGKGLASMAFVAFVIGLANCMSLILTQGNILHTIVHFLTAPLMDLPRSVASVGMTAVISVVNLLIPSASSKAAILVPILQPVSEALGLMPELAVQAFQYGDGFSNMISPMLGWTVGSCVTAGLPFPKWAKWALPKMLCFLLIGFVIMFCLTEFGWQPF